MTKIKKICLLIAVTLQFSTSCFSQGSPNDYTNVKIIRLVNPIQILQTKKSGASTSNNGTVLSADNKIENENRSAKINTDYTNQCTGAEVNKLTKSIEKTNSPIETATIKRTP